ncbi:hypothetical protein CHCC14821_0443 [Bacillus paralicheniformis]|nr:hypothetical protein CHCC14821_0443 [Bacillus paralicheniformis]
MIVSFGGSRGVPERGDVYSADVLLCIAYKRLSKIKRIIHNNNKIIFFNIFLL